MIYLLPLPGISPLNVSNNVEIFWFWDCKLRRIFEVRTTYWMSLLIKCVCGCVLMWKWQLIKLIYLKIQGFLEDIWWRIRFDVSHTQWGTSCILKLLFWKFRYQIFVFFSILSFQRKLTLDFLVHPSFPCTLHMTGSKSYKILVKNSEFPLHICMAYQYKFPHHFLWPNAQPLCTGFPTSFLPSCQLHIIDWLTVKLKK